MVWFNRKTALPSAFRGDQLVSKGRWNAAGLSVKPQSY
jgi:uncharacterized protein YodC (DUF2158 family)